MEGEMSALRSITTICATAACALMLAAGGASAQSAANTAVGKWTVNWSFDATPGMAPVGTQEICILAGGTWYSPSFAGWSGRWFQKGMAAAGNGDHVRLTGNYAGNAGNDSFELDFVTVNMMSGPWSEWRDNYAYLGLVRSSFTRAGACTAMKALTPMMLKAAGETKADPMAPKK
jgi:hypothetical protein